MERTAYPLFSTPVNNGANNIPNGVSSTARENKRYARLERDSNTYVETTVTTWVVGLTTLSEFKAQPEAMGIQDPSQADSLCPLL